MRARATRDRVQGKAITHTKRRGMGLDHARGCRAVVVLRGESPALGSYGGYPVRHADLRLVARDLDAGLHQLDHVAVRVDDVGLEHAVAAGARPAGDLSAARTDAVQLSGEIVDFQARSGSRIPWSISFDR